MSIDTCSDTLFNTDINHLLVNTTLFFGHVNMAQFYHRCTADEQWLGVGNIIEKIIDSRYIGIFKTYRQIIVIEKNIIGHYRKIIVIENLHLISSDKHSSKNKSKRVFHIPNEYEFVFENNLVWVRAQGQ